MRRCRSPVLLGRLHARRSRTQFHPIKNGEPGEDPMMLTERDRLRILRTIKHLVLQKHINVANPNQDYGNWAALLDQCTPDLVRAEDVQAFESGVRKILAALGSSHTALFHASGNDVPPLHTINATLR